MKARHKCRPTKVSAALFLFRALLSFEVFLPSFPDRLAKDIFDLGVETSEFVCSPAVEFFGQLRGQPEEKWLSFGHGVRPLLV